MATKAAKGASIFFRFEGKLGTGVDSIDVKVPLSALKAFPKTLLSKLAEDTWKSDNTAGDTKDNPLVTRPMDGPCSEHWSPSLAELIVETYNFKHAKEGLGLIAAKIYRVRDEIVHAILIESHILDIRYNEKDEWGEEGVFTFYRNKRKIDQWGEDEAPQPSLPTGVELEDVLAVLDFYGFPLSDEERIRLRLQLKQLALVGKAIKFVVAELERNPRRQTLFMFASQHHDLDFINRSNTFLEEGDSPNEVVSCLKAGHSPNKVVRVGGDSSESTEHYGWACFPCMQLLFIKKLQQKLPSFKVKYLTNDFEFEPCFAVWMKPELIEPMVVFSVKIFGIPAPRKRKLEC